MVCLADSSYGVPRPPSKLPTMVTLRIFVTVEIGSIEPVDLLKLKTNYITS
jgi:hypothetical protein